MIIFRNIVAASSILLVLISPPAVVEGTCKCKKVCPNYERSKFNEAFCWDTAKYCWDALVTMPSKCNAFCVCNFFACNCDGCEAVPGAWRNIGA